MRTASGIPKPSPTFSPIESSELEAVAGAFDGDEVVVSESGSGDVDVDVDIDVDIDVDVVLVEGV